MGHRVPFTWADFHDLLGGAPWLQKLAVVNVRCSNVPVAPCVLMPRLKAGSGDRAVASGRTCDFDMQARISNGGRSCFDFTRGNFDGI